MSLSTTVEGESAVEQLFSIRGMSVSMCII